MSQLSRVPQFIGLVTLGAGVALLAAPRQSAQAAHLGDRPTLARVIGVMDLALVPGLLAGRPRWPWMLARAAFNVPIIAAYRAQAERPGGDGVARAGMSMLAGLTVMDTVTALRLRRAETAAP